MASLKRGLGHKSRGSPSTQSSCAFGGHKAEGRVHSVMTRLIRLWEHVRQSFSCATGFRESRLMAWLPSLIWSDMPTSFFFLSYELPRKSTYEHG